MMSVPDQQSDATEPPAPTPTVTITVDDYTRLTAAADQHRHGTNLRMKAVAEMIQHIRVAQTRPTDLASLERQMTAVLVALEMINAELLDPMDRIREIQKRASPPHVVEAHLPSRPPYGK